MNIPEAQEREQQTALKMSSIHLNTAAKTLQQLTHLEKMAVNDSLTGMFNRRYFDQQLHKEVSHIQREKLGTLSCVFVDIDDFKEVNDNYGHQIGDTALKKIVSCISHCAREYEIPAHAMVVMNLSFSYPQTH